MTDADWVQQERDHEYRMARLKEDSDDQTRRHRTERWVAAMWAFGIVGAIVALSALIYFWQHDSGQRGQEVKLACVQSGGTWTGVGGGSPTCIRIIGEK